MFLQTLYVCYVITIQKRRLIYSPLVKSREVFRSGFVGGWEMVSIYRMRRLRTLVGEGEDG